MANSDGPARAVRLPAGAVALLAAAVLTVALHAAPPTPSRFQAPVAGAGGPAVPAPAPAPAPLGLTAPGPVAPAAPAPVAPPPPAAVPPPAGVAPIPAPAPPPVPLTDDVQQRVQQALDTLGYPWQELGWDLHFEPYQGGLLGLADPATRQITVFVKADSTVQQLRVVLAHEVGHALDVQHPEQRARYRALRAIPADVPWYPCDRCEDYDSPAGDFAEVFAAWLVGATDFRSRVAPLPDDAQLRELVPLFAPPSARVEPAEPAPSQPERRRPRPSSSPRPIVTFPGG